jgi:ribose transport system substrate-binding protein
MTHFKGRARFRVAASIVAAGALVATASAFGAAGLQLGESSPVASNPNQQAITRGEDLAAKHYGWTVKTLDANLSPDKQVSDVDTFISLKVKGLITWTLDPGAAGAAYKRALAAGIPIVDFGSTQNVTSSVFDARGYGCGQGQAAASYIAKRVPKGKVIVIGGPPVPAITNYTNCFVSAARADGLNIVGKQYNVKDTATTAQPIVQDLLTKNPDVNAIWCYNDPSCLGAGAVVRSSGKQAWVEGKGKGIVITGANGSADAAAAVKDGLITGTWDPQPSDMGRIAVQILAMHLKDGKALSALPKVVVVPNKIWDASNVSGYVDPLKRPVVIKPIPKAWIVKQ